MLHVLPPPPPPLQFVWKSTLYSTTLLQPGIMWKTQKVCESKVPSSLTWDKRREITPYIWQENSPQRLTDLWPLVFFYCIRPAPG